MTSNFKAVMDEEDFLIELATVMHKHVTNWPEDKIKKASTALKLLDKVLRDALNPKKHNYWSAGEPDCPKDIKASNGEIHTLRCKACGNEDLTSHQCIVLP